jgi:hypothetical protein
MKKSIVAGVSISAVVIILVLGYLAYAMFIPTARVVSYKSDAIESLNTAKVDLDAVQSQAASVDQALDTAVQYPQTAHQQTQAYQSSLDKLSSDYSNLANQSKLKNYPLIISPQYKKAVQASQQLEDGLTSIQKNINDEKDLNSKADQIVTIVEKYKDDLQSEDPETLTKAYGEMYKELVDIYKQLLNTSDFQNNEKILAFTEAGDKFLATYSAYQADPSEAKLAQLETDATDADNKMTAADDEIQVISNNNLQQIADQHNQIVNGVNAL